MTKKVKPEVNPKPAAPPEPVAKAATRRGFQTCCCTCVRRPWCESNPTKGRQVCSASRRSPGCIDLINRKWCTVCPLHAGQSEMEDPDQTKMFQDNKDAASQ